MSVSAEKVFLLFLFPIITLTLFIVAAIGFWFIKANPLGLF